ncbi:MAG: prolipoprotein diacylglyceryl transferase [Dialister micraerophilus]|uniref:prolipoprotein diacylglyceryl transferase n=1 Tax=Dialister micraerophilus TaxID=309120 RepID=UPI0023F097FE|nr:prolipoprotein diacylglyceryl transferase [Dialister micraerophilus]MDK8253150.1 prolipoprotein diacylglyceryl transferase [Dialister micraerophilus]MDK8285688.1 prolipoprotein diacylglyceryl transferase [Dialister micraerophilus]
MHQYLTFIGNFPIRFYGIFFSFGIIAGCIIAYFLLKKEGHGWEKILFDFGLVISFSGIIGGRLWDVFFFDWQYYHNHLLEIPFIWQGGMAIQGGLLFSAIAAYFFLKKHGIPILPFADTISPAIILGQAIGRIANFMNGDAFGHPTGSSFGLLYPKTTLAYKTFGSQPLWPAEVWECQGDLIIFVLLIWFSCSKRPKGTVFCLYLMLYSILRFFLEYLRGDYAILAFGLKSAQITSVIVFILASVFFIYFSTKNKTNT